MKGKTLVVEQLCGLGGVGTLGAISIYCSGNRVGFTAEVGGGNSWVIEQKMRVVAHHAPQGRRRRLVRHYGLRAPWSMRGRVRGSVVVTPSGRGVVLAKVVVDATGNADVAAAAGAACVYTDASEFAMQGTGLPGRETRSHLHQHRLHLHRRNRPGRRLALDGLGQGQVSGGLRPGPTGRYPASAAASWATTRSRMLRPAHAAHLPDSIALAMAGYDTHGYMIDPGYLLRSPAGRLTSYVPYRCLLAQGAGRTAGDRHRPERPPRRPAGGPYAARHPESGLCRGRGGGHGRAGRHDVAAHRRPCLAAAPGRDRQSARKRAHRRGLAAPGAEPWPRP